ncbi:PREDICTED: receptor-like protein 12 [Tarenaya hassleriana]|uniref:receptor-like protein 12 n=1 Tax=Tarenaya hassleriana TaxID=28532 RepID=UPI00053C879C|nr:PREDICTED: receptor-like protein 12 [Tarenaya hassleriana]
MGVKCCLQGLDLSNNMIKGQVPHWLWRLPFLLQVNISHNSLSSFQASSSQQILLESTLRAIDLRSNDFQGPLFIPPSHSIQYLGGSNNNFTGGIPQSICALMALELLDLSHNNLNGSVPGCLGNHNGSLTVLNLRHNQLSGTLPDMFVDANKLRSIDLSGNRLEGKLPKSLVSCSSLEVLNVASNRIKDTFPFWLASLQDLQVLSLRSNEFHGEVYLPEFPFGFSKLRVIDISNNHFNGTLPSDYFAGWAVISSMGSRDVPLGSMGIVLNSGYYYSESIVLTNKGIELEYERILTTFTAIDFSRNAFRGEIPESIGLLKGLYAFNLSSNAFAGHIPTSLANMTELESLDLSLNNLSGRIPSKLGSLTFLARMNFSYNQLTGPIPKGTQFGTQNSSSFEHNLGLCGPPLDHSCGEVKTPASDVSEPEDDEEKEEEKLSWIAVALGFAPGLLFGVALGHIGFSYKREWLMKIFGLTR